MKNDILNQMNALDCLFVPLSFWFIALIKRLEFMVEIALRDCFRWESGRKMKS